MNPYQRRLANFTPVMLAQGAPGMSAGNMAGMQQLHQGVRIPAPQQQLNGMTPVVDPGQPMRIPEETMEQLKRDSQQQSIQNPQVGITNGLTQPNGMSILGGPIGAQQPQGTWTTPIRVDAGIENIHGAEARGFYDQQNRRFGISGRIPVGPAEQGLSITGNFDYTQGYGDRPAGYGFGLGFEKRNPIDPETYRKSVESPAARKLKGGFQIRQTPQYQYQAPPMPY